MSYTLEDAGEPTPQQLADITALQPGDFTKILFVRHEPHEDGMDSESMWLSIFAVDRTPSGVRFGGHLQNWPIVVEDLTYGDAISSDPCNIIDWADEAEMERRAGEI